MDVLQIIVKPEKFPNLPTRLIRLSREAHVSPKNDTTLSVYRAFFSFPLLNSTVDGSRHIVAINGQWVNGSRAKANR